MTVLQHTPGRKVTRRLEDPATAVMGSRRRDEPGMLAEALAVLHNDAVREYGSDSGGVHAFNPEQRATEGVYESGGNYPRHTVITKLSWGRIDPELAQRILETDGVA